MAGDKLTRSDFINEDILGIGKAYADSLKPALEATKEWMEYTKQAAIAVASLSKSSKEATSLKDLVKIKKEVLDIAKKEAQVKVAEQNALIAVERKKQALLNTTKKEIELKIKKLALDDKEITLLKKKDTAAEKSIKVKERERLADLKLSQAREAAFDKFEADLNKKVALEKKAVTDGNAARLKEADLIERNKNVLLKNKEAAIHLSRAYVKLVKEQQRSKKSLQDLIAKGNVNNRQIRKAQREYDKLTAKVNRVNKATSNFARKGLGSTILGFKNLLGAFGIIGGVTLIAQLGRDVFDLIKTFDGLNFALEKISGSQFEAANTQRFLLTLTRDFGVELVSTTNRYIKFSAAAKQSGVSVKETEDIFRSMTKAAAVLGLKTHELEGVYLALEQMLSKGKVTTEELRRQLGERLPGAMGIMAASMGVTISQLDKMLKKGEVLSAEVLPAFADAVEIAYGIESVKKVETLISAQNRMSASWQNFVRVVTDGDSVIKKVLSGIIDYVGYVGDAFAFVFGGEDNRLQESVAKYEKEISEHTERQAKIAVNSQQKWGERKFQLRAKLLAKDAELLEMYAGKEKDIVAEERRVILSKLIDFNESLEAEQKKHAKSSFDEALRIYKEAKVIYLKTKEDAEKGVTKIITSTQTTHTPTGNIVREVTEEIKVSVEEVDKAADDYAKAIARFNVFRKLASESKSPDEKEEEKEGTGEKRARAKVIATEKIESKKAIIGLLKEELALVNKLIELEENDHTRRKYRILKKAIEENIAIEEKGKSITLAGQAEIEKGIQGIIDAEKERLAQEERNDKARQKMDDAHLARIDKLIEKLHLINDFVQLGADLGIAIVERKVVALEYEKDAIEEKYDAELEGLDLLSDKENETEVEKNAREKRERILKAEKRKEEKRIEKEIAKEKTKQAKINKAAALAQAAIYTAVAVVGALSALPWSYMNIVNAVIMGALGTIQVAAIAAEPIPKFRKGKKSSNKYEGWALTNEVTQEFQEDSSGRISPIQGRNTMTHVKSDDIIHKDFNAMVDYHSNDDLIKQAYAASMLTSLQIDNNELSKRQAQQKLNENLSNEKFKDDVKGILKGWKFHNHIDNTQLADAIAEKLDEREYWNKMN